MMLARPEALEVRRAREARAWAIQGDAIRSLDCAGGGFAVGSGKSASQRSGRRSGAVDDGGSADGGGLATEGFGGCGAAAGFVGADVLLVAGEAGRHCELVVGCWLLVCGGQG